MMARSKPLSTIQSDDPALCCGTGVCGVRYNLAQQPRAFAENSVVRGVLECSGEGALLVVVVDGQLALRHLPATTT